MSINSKADYTKLEEKTEKKLKKGSNEKLDGKSDENKQKFFCCFKVSEKKDIFIMEENDIFRDYKIINPSGLLKTIWDIIIVIVILSSVIQIPLLLVFSIPFRIYNINGILSLIFDFVLFLDIIINFRTAYFHKEDKLRLITNPKKIGLNYLKGWFFLDFLTSFPFEFIISSNFTLVKILRTCRLVRIIKILRLVKVARYSDKIESKIIGKIFIYFKIFKTVTMILLFAHFSACAWFYISYETFDSEDGSWLKAQFKSKEIISKTSKFKLYTCCWYWSIMTLFTNGDIIAHNLVEKWFASTCVFVGSVFFAYFIGNLIFLINIGSKRKQTELNTLEEAKIFSDEKKLKTRDKISVMNSVKYFCSENHMLCEEYIMPDCLENETRNHIPTMKMLPTCLQNKIRKHISEKNGLKETKIFKDLGLNDYILGEIKFKMIHISYDQYLYEKGEFADEIYIQRSKRSKIKYDGKEVETFRGDVFGTHAFIHKRRLVNVVCRKATEFIVMKVSDIKNVLEKYDKLKCLEEIKKVKDSIPQYENRNNSKELLERKANYQENIKREFDSGSDQKNSVISKNTKKNFFKANSKKISDSERQERKENFLKIKKLISAEFKQFKKIFKNSQKKNKITETELEEIPRKSFECQERKENCLKIKKLKSAEFKQFKKSFKNFQKKNKSTKTKLEKISKKSSKCEKTNDADDTVNGKHKNNFQNKKITTLLSQKNDSGLPGKGSPKKKF